MMNLLMLALDGYSIFQLVILCILVVFLVVYIVLYSLWKKVRGLAISSLVLYDLKTY